MHSERAKWRDRRKKKKNVEGDKGRERERGRKRERERGGRQGLLTEAGRRSVRQTN